MDTTKPKTTGNAITTPRDEQSGQATGKRQHMPVSPKVNNEKLDDLKNPFDTTKKIKTAQQSGNTSISQSTNERRQYEPVNQKVNNEKLDDLKNPFDTTKKVKPIQQQPGAQNKSNDRYANQEISYLKSDGNEVAVETLDVKPTDKPKSSQKVNGRRKRKS